MKDYRTERTKEILNQIRDRIEERGYKHEHVAKQIGLNKRQFSDLLCGRKILTADYLLGLVEFLELEIGNEKRREL